MVGQKWAIYDSSAPIFDGIEVNKGYLNNGVFSLTDNGGVYVSKLLINSYTQIVYVQRSAVSSLINNGTYIYATYLSTENAEILATETGDSLVI